MAGAVLVQQFFHLSRFQQQSTAEWSRQRQFAAAHGGQVAGESKQGPAAPTDQIVKLLVIDRSLCNLGGGELASDRFVHDIFPLPAQDCEPMVHILRLSSRSTSEEIPQFYPD
jgi:hypothetical protein